MLHTSMAALMAEMRVVQKVVLKAACLVVALAALWENMKVATLVVYLAAPMVDKKGNFRIQREDLRGSV